ncbi:MAG: hypothetical protein PCFJNLEI_01720 [Verrucomicrobiae bacterium]|nr:hypothetical protein [Verrucomicrobiae bacterium]
MKITRQHLAGVGLWCSVLGGALAGESANPLSFTDGKVTFDVQERLRLEVRENNFDFNNNSNPLGHVTDDTFLLQRFRLGLTIKPCGWVTLYGQGQDSREIDSTRPNVPFAFGSEGDDSFDLRQAYLQVGNPKEFPLSVKVGRQELSYGDERLIGTFDWNNFSRTFDAVKVRYEDQSRHFWVDAFAGHVVTIEDRGPQGNYGEDFNNADWNDTLVGVYLRTTALQIQTADFYLLYRHKKHDSPIYTAVSGTLTNKALAYDIAQEIWTPGFRIKSTPGALHGWDYEAEAAYQFGRSAGQQGGIPGTFPSSTMIDHEAFAGHVGAGYTWETAAWKPRLGLEYNVASGDSNPNDNKDESFLNLFPTNHKFYGYMDLFAWKNMHNPAASLKFKPYQDGTRPYHNLTIQLDGQAFWLYTNEDAWYRANAVARVRPLNAAALSADTFVGTELDLTVNYNTPWKWVKLQAGYSHFFAGSYVQQTASGNNGQDDADFGYLQTVITF